MLCLRNGFEAGANLPDSMQQYKKFADEMYELGGLLFVPGRFIIPSTMRPYILQLTHKGHLGMEKCKTMARHTWRATSRTSLSRARCVTASGASKPPNPCCGTQYQTDHGRRWV